MMPRLGAGACVCSALQLAREPRRVVRSASPGMHPNQGGEWCISRGRLQSHRLPAARLAVDRFHAPRNPTSFGGCLAAVVRFAEFGLIMLSFYARSNIGSQEPK
eukprot:1197673-Pyramimonas_sp.AAC.1